MKAIILAAGRGSRMKNLTEAKPKCLVEFRGQTLLAWQLAALRGAGISEIGICTGYRRELLQDYGLVEFHNPDWASTNMVSSLAVAEPWLQTEPCVVSYSDIFYDSSAIEGLVQNNSAMAITYDPNWLQLWKKRFADPLSDAESFRRDSQGNLLEIGNKASEVAEIEGQYMGLLRFTPASWAVVQKIRSNLPSEQCNRLQMTHLLQMMLLQQQSVYTVPYDGEWAEFDSEDDLQAIGAA